MDVDWWSVAVAVVVVATIGILRHIAVAHIVVPYSSDPASGDQQPVSFPVAKGTPVKEVLCLQPLALGALTLRNRVVKAAAFGGADFEQLIQEHAQVHMLY